MKTSHNKSCFPSAQLVFTSCLFCPTIIPKPKYIEFTIAQDKQGRKIIIFKKVKLGNISYLCFIDYQKFWIHLLISNQLKTQR